MCVLISTRHISSSQQSHVANGYYIRADSDLFKAAETTYSASRDSLGSKDSKLVLGLNNGRNYSFLFHCKTELKYQKQKAGEKRIP